MHNGVYPTASGMHCLWDLAAFTEVSDYDSWARELLEEADIERHISAGRLVPLNIGSDGAMAIEIRVGSQDSNAALTDRETQYLIVQSDPYRLCSTEAVGVSGIEYVAVPPESSVGLDIASTWRLRCDGASSGMGRRAGNANGRWSGRRSTPGLSRPHQSRARTHAVSDKGAVLRLEGCGTPPRWKA